MYTDGGWEYGGDGMDAPFHPATDSPSHKKGGSIIFFTTDLERIRRRIAHQEDSPTDTIEYVAIRIDHGEVVGRGPNPQATGTTGSPGNLSKADRPGAIGQTYWIGL